MESQKRKEFSLQSRRVDTNLADIINKLEEIQLEEYSRAAYNTIKDFIVYLNGHAKKYLKQIEIHKPEIKDCLDGIASWCKHYRKRVPKLDPIYVK